MPLHTSEHRPLRSPRRSVVGGILFTSLLVGVGVGLVADVSDGVQATAAVASAMVGLAKLRRHGDARAQPDDEGDR